MNAERPTITPRGEEQLFYRGLAENELRYQQCTSCTAIVFPLRTLCNGCGGVDLEVRSSAGCGQVYSFTTHHRASHPFFADRVPYTVVLVDLDEGFRVLGGTRATESEVQVGRAVRAEYLALDDELTVLEFVPIRDSHDVAGVAA